MNCPKCGRKAQQAKGQQNNSIQFRCTNKSCNQKYFTIKLVEEKTDFEQSDDNIRIVCSSPRIKTKDDAIKHFNIDLSQWKIVKFRIKTSEGYRKDKQTNWNIDSKGKVRNSYTKDSGKMLVVPLYHTEVILERKVEEIKLNLIKEDLINDIKKHKPNYKTIQYKKNPKGFLFEPDMPDIHFGKLCWNQESGDNYDIKIAKEMALEHLNSLVNQANNYDIDRILFPIGNDFFNTDNPEDTTTRGTPQQQDIRFKKMFKKGRELCVSMIDMLSAIAPIDIKIIVGNHDTNTAFFLGDSLECWYNGHKSIAVDNLPVKRKYYSYGKNLIGLTHGYYEKLNELPLIMATEQPKLWAESTCKEWQTGDKHHKKEIRTSMLQHEQMGVMVRILRSISGNDTWHFDKGYIGQNRMAEGFIRHKEKGLICQFNSNI